MKVEIKNGKIKGYATVKEMAKKWVENHHTVTYWAANGTIPKMYLIKIQY